MIYPVKKKKAGWNDSLRRTSLTSWKHRSAAFKGIWKQSYPTQIWVRTNVNFFLERCYSQSTRLTGLLRDISVLNRLDEASEMFDLTEVNITKLIAEIQKECSQDMEEKHITSEIILPGDPTVFGNNSLLYSIFRNLYDTRSLMREKT